MGSYRCSVIVEVANVWESPTSPRPIDGPSVADRPDPVAWLEALDGVPDGRLGLHDRLLTQLVRGEPVEVVEDAVGGWVRVVCPNQPSGRDPKGYPGWVRVAHLGPFAPPPGRAGGPTPSVSSVVERCRAFGGTAYLWGGTSRFGVDCSGLVHRVLGDLGVVVPRDAADQQRALGEVCLAEVRPGDLYFFAREGRPAHHVGVVTAPMRMVHAPETGAVVIEEDVSPQRRATLVGAARPLP